MKYFKEFLIFMLASMVFVYVVSIFTFTPHNPSLIYYPSLKEQALWEGLGLILLFLSFSRKSSTFNPALFD